MRKEIVIASPVRTPIGRFGGALKELTAAELGAVAAREALRRGRIDPQCVDLLIYGHGRQAGAGPNPARQIAQRSGLPHEACAWTVNQACASGMRSIVDAMLHIECDEARVVLAGGVESMSNTPYLLPRARWGYRLGHSEVVDGMYRDGFLCPLCGDLMGATAERLAEQYSITRTEQDRWAASTQQRCELARREGRFKSELTPVEIHTRDGVQVVEVDEHPRDGVSEESLSRLEPVFKRGGTVHAGNSSGITDGAAAMLVLSAEAAAELGVRPLARVLGWSQAGVDPAVMGIGPVPAVRKLLARLELELADFDLVELNEAFAAQLLACDRELKFDHDKLNVNGGAIALGHPIGATGARIVVTLLHELERRGAQRGLATLCVSGGMGMALALERV